MGGMSSAMKVVSISEGFDTHLDLDMSVGLGNGRQLPIFQATIRRTLSHQQRKFGSINVCEAPLPIRISASKSGS